MVQVFINVCVKQRRGEMASTKQKMSKNKDDAPCELESQCILRLPPEYASTVRRAVQSGSVALKDRLTIELHADGRHGIVRVDRVPLAAKLVDLPCIIESLKTIDKKTFYKTADVCQYIESPDVEKEVKRLLSTDAEAVSVRWEIIAEDETKEADHHGSLTGLDISSPGMSGHKQGHGSSEHDELREIFNDISSSSEDEDERDHHDDEDLNIMDTEEDLERRLQGKLNESDGQQQENEGTNQIALGIQKQIDNLKDTLQETQERRKRQEDLIMRVENLALKTRLQAVLDEFKQQEEREKQELASLQEQLEALMEK
ncbi:PREDICTED: transcription initiation factor TFIID subunit 7-like [Gekko japonicus]|uniref:Transcription initiation factor TFIID subunit 7-like n=1 Tax=Gekko japonicus TaxID=146911 RepID=A0ABM1L9X8_GEKJA|nr:PREDICTED: transcription initiation factor TFIID subunit 7-like [Gekko japonicus]